MAFIISFYHPRALNDFTCVFFFYGPIVFKKLLQYLPLSSSSAQVEERSLELEELEIQVQKVWEETRILYEEGLEILLLQRELEQAESWLSSYESSLLAEVYGVGVNHPPRFLSRRQ